MDPGLQPFGGFHTGPPGGMAMMGGRFPDNFVPPDMNPAGGMGGGPRMMTPISYAEMGMAPPSPGMMIGSPAGGMFPGMSVHSPPPGHMPPGMFAQPQPVLYNTQNPYAPPIYPCRVCGNEVSDNDQAVLCESGCHFWFHRQCIGLAPEAFKLLGGEIYAEWLCDLCATSRPIPLIKTKA